MIFSWLAIAAAFAPGIARADGLYLGAGLAAQDMLKVVNSPTGGRRLFGNVAFPEWQLGYRSGAWFPLLGFTLPGARGDDGTYRRYLFRLQLPYVFALGVENMEAKAGAGLRLLLLRGRGGSLEVANGNGTTTFYAPAGARYARWLYLTAGLGYRPGAGPWRVDLDVELGSPLSGKRALGLALGGGYVF